MIKHEVQQLGPRHPGQVQTVVEQVRECLDPVVQDAGAVLYDVEFTGSVLRLLVDRDGGINVSAIQSISRSASRVLDDVDPIPGRYTLEVSSPGLERSLRTPDHFRQALGKKLKVKTQIPSDGVRWFVGELASADETGIELTTPDGSHRFGYEEITKSRTVFDWGAAARTRSQETRS